MKQIIILIAAGLVSCTNTVSTQKETGETKNEKEQTAFTIQLNNGAKWKADSITKVHIAEMIGIVSDSAYKNPGKSVQLSTELQNKADALVKDCKMQGNEHKALHEWLQQLLKGIKELKEDEADEYSKVYEALKQHIAGFYNYFE
jgi:hypothetical protein